MFLFVYSHTPLQQQYACSRQILRKADILVMNRFKPAFLYWVQILESFVSLQLVFPAKYREQSHNMVWQHARQQRSLARAKNHFKITCTFLVSLAWYTCQAIPRTPCLESPSALIWRPSWQIAKQEQHCTKMDTFSWEPTVWMQGSCYSMRILLLLCSQKWNAS
jgi:hypothetical protein